MDFKKIVRYSIWNHRCIVLQRGTGTYIEDEVNICWNFLKKQGFLLNSSQDMEMSKKSRSNLTRQMLPLETIQRKLDMSIKLWYRAGAKKIPNLRCRSAHSIIFQHSSEIRDEWWNFLSRETLQNFSDFISIWKTKVASSIFNFVLLFVCWHRPLHLLEKN